MESEINDSAYCLLSIYRSVSCLAGYVTCSRFIVDKDCEGIIRTINGPYRLILKA